MSGVIWHDIECGRYTADLPLWRALADQFVHPGQAVLDVAAGTGRVTLELARAGHAVVALDHDPELLAELARRATGLEVSTICADARSFTVPDRRFPLIAVPMQSIQLFGDADGRLAFLRRAREHLAPGGVIAIAITVPGDFEEFTWNDGDSFPLPDVAEAGGRAYFSQPTAVRRRGQAFMVERRREVVDADGAHTRTHDAIALAILTVETLEQEGVQAGLHAAGLRRVEATEEHIGSQVVLLGD